jgi:hypothetical protein
MRVNSLIQSVCPAGADSERAEVECCSDKISIAGSTVIIILTVVFVGVSFPQNAQFPILSSSPKRFYQTQQV